MRKPVKVPELQALATKMVGDGKSPDLFFVTDQGVVVGVSLSFQAAYSQWLALADRGAVESALENRNYGTLAWMEPPDPEREGTPRWKRRDDTTGFLKRRGRYVD